MNVLVLGATGFIGGQIARAALEAGWTVRALRRRPNAVGALGDVADRVEWAPGSLNGATLSEVMRGCDVVFHAAAFYAERTKDVTGSVRHGVTEMRHVLAAFAASGAKRLVYTSSLTTVGRSPDAHRLADERDFYIPHSTNSAYYESKYVMEMEAYRAAAGGLDVVILCPTAVFGPGDVKPTTGAPLIEVARGRAPASFEATVNIVDGRDLASAHIAAAQRGQSGQRYIIGGHNVTLSEALKVAAQEAGVALPRWRISRRLVLGLIRAMDILPFAVLPDTMRMVGHLQPLNTSKAQRELGLAEPRSLQNTVKDTLAWFRANEYL
jgi:dihydroflavonol-4-reductase